MEKLFNPSKSEEFAPDVELKKKHLNCRGCNVGNRNKLWKEYIAMLKSCKRNNSAPDSYVFFKLETDNTNRHEPLQVFLGGRKYGLLGTLSISDTEDVMMLINQGCKFFITIPDYNRVGESAIPIVMNYAIVQNQGTAEAPAAEEASAPDVPVIVNFASKEPYARIEFITPELAKQMLEHNTNNRSLNPKLVGDIADSIKHGHFQFTSSSIGFDQNGVLTDGQHRLHAIALSGIGVNAAVVYGCNQSPYQDRGKRRTVKDNLTICFGNEYSDRVISMINHLYRIVSGKHDSLDETKQHIAYEKIRTIVEKSEFSATFNNPKTLFSSYYSGAILILLLSKKYKEEDIEDLNSLFQYGMHVEGMPNRLQDSMVHEVHDMILSARKPFVRKNVSQDLNLDVEKTMSCMRVMIPYLSGLKVKKSQDDVNKFCKSVLTPFFEEVNKEFLLANEKQG